MPVTSRDKGKAKAISSATQDPPLRTTLSSGSSSDSSNSDSDSSPSSDPDSSEDEEEEEVTQEYLNSLLEKARQNALARSTSSNIHEEEEDVIQLAEDPPEPPLPPLDPGSLPTSYIELGESRIAGPSKVRDLDAERAEKVTAKIQIPEKPAPFLVPTKDGKRLTKKQIKAMRHSNAGKDWFDMPAPAEADLPRLHREYEALRLRNQLDPKRFYRKEDGEGKGIKGLPKHFAIGTIVAEKTPFNTPSSDNLPRAQRKRTLVDELVDDAEAKGYAKKKFKELQQVRGARGKKTLANKKAARKPKW